jgi:hypothetical protein
VAAALLGTAALNTLGAGILGPSNRALDQSEVRARLAAAPAPSVVAPSPSSAAAGTPPATAPPASTPSGTGGAVTATPAPPPQTTAAPPPPPVQVPQPQPRTEVLATAGGTVVAECVGDQVTLRSWSPAQGYRVDDVDRGPATRARVKFKAGKGNEVRTDITCVGGVPTAATRDHD